MSLPMSHKAVAATATRPPSDAHTRVFRSSFDVWVPALLMCALIVFCGAILQEPLIAFASVIVFLLGIVPQAKMKRADLLVTLQGRFSELQSDTRALGIWADSEAPTEEDERKEAYAFYMKFWNLQILEFGLWRYGMIPSDTYAHWIVRRLLSFSPENSEEYFHTKPLRGWTRVQREFVGTDFQAFMDAALEIGTRVYQERCVVKATQEDYDALHARIERLLVHAGGGGLWSTFIVRWFSARRPSLRTRKQEDWADVSMKPLMRESPGWTRFFVIVAALSVPSAFFAGVQLRPVLAHLFSPPAQSVPLRAASQRGIVIFEPEPPRSRFVVRFADEGACVPHGEARGWHGAAPSSWSRAFVTEVGQNLAACSTAERRVKIEVVGFASSSEFKEPVDCGPDIKSSAQANLRLANARAENVKALLDRKLTNGEVLVRKWSDFVDMEDERTLGDRLSSGGYDPRKGPLNRRAEIRVLDAGACE
jgi:hypothetical protein